MTGPLHVLFINSIQMWGGAEVWLMDVMHGLTRRGHRTSLACRPGTILEKNARAVGCDVIPVAMRSDFDPAVVARIVRLLRSRHVDVISTNMDKELRFGGLAARLTGGIAVVPSREVDYPLKNKLRYRFTYNALADHILANSVSTKRSLLMNAPWLSPDRIEVIYKGIDPEPYLTNPDEGLALRDELGIARDAPVVGFVGQIIERKGIPDLVWSIPRVVEKVPGVRFLFAGEGKLTEFLLAKARELGVSDHVVHAGFRKDIPAVMKALDLLVLPSVVEGFGYVLVEAMAAARPVVATNVSSIPEIVQNDESGILVDVHNPDQLAAAMVVVLESRDRGREMGERGRHIMLEKFTLERMVDRIEAAFLAARARKRRH